DVAGGAPDLGEQLPAALPLPAQLERSRRGEEAHERIREIELCLADLGLWHGIHARGDRLPANRLLRPHRRVRHAHLGAECAGVELVERGHEALAAEAAQPTVREAVGATGDAVVVLVIRVGVGKDDRLWHGVEQPAAEDDLALREASLLGAVEAAQRVAGFERSLTAAREQHEGGGRAGPRRRHGARLFSSILSATRPVAVRRQSARTTSPGCRSPSAMAAPSPNTAVAGCVRMCTRRTASPTPMMRSTAPLFTA